MNSSVVKEKMRDFSNNQIHFEREKDPVGEKTTKNRNPQRGAAAGGRRSYFGGLLSDRVFSSLKINLIVA